MANNYQITPIGELQHPWINKPDTKYNDEGLFHTKLILEGKAAEDLKAKIDGAAKAHFNEYTDEMKPAEAKKWEVYVPYEAELDDDTGEETGRTIFTFKQNHKIVLKDGSTKVIKIEIRDAADKVMDKAVFGGSEGRIMFSTRGIEMVSSKQAGVRLDFAKVQITKMGQGGSGKGFGAVEGGYEADPEDAGFGESDGGSAGDY